MAHSARDFEGWSYSQNIIPLSSDDEADSGLLSRRASLRTSSRRPRRATAASTNTSTATLKPVSFRENPSNILLRRAADALELRIGDAVLYNDDYVFERRHELADAEYDPSENTVHLIKKISLHTDDYVEVVAATFYSKRDIDDTNRRAGAAVPYLDPRNELFLTPFLSKLALRHVVKKVTVHSEREFTDRGLLGNTTGVDFVCRRACDSYTIDMTTRAFDYGEVLEQLFANETKFSQNLASMVHDEGKEPTTPRKNTPRKAPAKSATKKTPAKGTPKKGPGRPRKNTQEEEVENSDGDEESNSESEKDDTSDERIDAHSNYESDDSGDEYSDADLSLSNSSFEVLSDDSDFEENVKSLSKSRKARRTLKKPSSTSPTKRRKTTTGRRSTALTSKNKRGSKSSGPKKSPVKKSLKDTTPRIPSRVIDLDHNNDSDNNDSDVVEVSYSPENSDRLFKKVSAKGLKTSPSKVVPSEPENAVLFKNAKEQLHTSALLASLPCREDEFAQLYLTLENLIREEMGSCIYISGTPGTGKTATVRKVIKELATRLNHTEMKRNLAEEVERRKTEKTKKPNKRKTVKKNAKSRAKKSAIDIDSDDNQDSSNKNNNNNNSSSSSSNNNNNNVTTIKDLEDQLRQLEKKSQTSDDKSYEEINKFDYVEINGLKLISPNACYEILWEKISGNNVSANTAKTLIENYLLEHESGQKSSVPLIILMDEIDQIITKNQSIMYNFFNWPTYNNSKFIVIAIANTMDLPERVLTNKISSRLGLSRLLFPGYTHDQLSTIIKARLESMDQMNASLQKVLKFENSAIEFASRRVAGVSGDARRALSICRRAVEIAELDYLKKILLNNNNTSNDKKDDGGGAYYVKINHIISAIQETTNSPIALYVMNLSILGKLFLAAILRRQKFTGFMENELADLVGELKRLVTMNLVNDTSPNFKCSLVGDLNVFAAYYGSSRSAQNAQSAQVMGLLYAIDQLVEVGLITQERNKASQSKLVKLCVADDEVYSALKKEKLFQKILG